MHVLHVLGEFIICVQFYQRLTLVPNSEPKKLILIAEKVECHLDKLTITTK